MKFVVVFFFLKNVKDQIFDGDFESVQINVKSQKEALALSNANQLFESNPVDLKKHSRSESEPDRETERKSNSITHSRLNADDSISKLNIEQNSDSNQNPMVKQNHDQNSNSRFSPERKSHSRLNSEQNSNTKINPKHIIGKLHRETNSDQNDKQAFKSNTLDLDNNNAPLKAVENGKRKSKTATDRNNHISRQNIERNNFYNAEMI